MRVFNGEIDGMARFDGKHIIIVGGCTLIGEVLARAFLAEGGRVTVGDIDGATGTRLAGSLGENFRYRPLDLLKDESIEGFIADSARESGGIDVLVNVACTYVDGGVNSTRAQWTEALGVNVVGMALTVTAALPHLRASKGVVLNFGSVAGKGARLDTLCYPTSKAAVLHMSRCLALGLARDGIRVNTLSPAWTWSKPLVDRTGNDRDWAKRAAAPLHMTRRFAEPEEVAACALFLCSPAASCVTGMDFAADGGYSAMGVDQGLSSGSQLMKMKDA